MSMKKWNNKIDEVIRLAENESPKYWRKGQAIFNFAYKIFPEETEKLRTTNFDCFYSDQKIPSFLKELDKLINNDE